MLVKTEAIVLNRIKYTDNSFVVNLYSQSEGKITVLARTSQRKPQAKANIFAPLNVIQTEFKIKDNRKVQNISYFELMHNSASTYSDISKICITQFIAEVVAKMVREEEKNSDLYLFLKETVTAISLANSNIVNLHLIFLKEFAKYLGFGITNNYCSETPYFNLREGMFLPLYTCDEEALDQNHSQAFSQMLNLSYDNNYLKFQYNYRKKMIEILLAYYKIHTENTLEIKSLKVLNEIFSE